MLRYDAAVREVCQVIEKAAQSALTAYAEGDAPWEENITDRLLGAIKMGVDDRQIAGISWRAKTLKTGRGRSGEESAIGADFVGTLSIDFPEYKVTKGFLVQAKRAEPGGRLKDWARLEEQSEKMLAQSPASFVLLYSNEIGMRIVPAISIRGLASQDPLHLYHQSLQWFFEQHLKCFIGDRNVDAGFVTRAMAADREPRPALLALSATRAEI
ncbi:hypothetical protein L1787_03620 [Acuticoccus sp. M5D2P5]|uniref:hypothetical protein n=1 Tax=Acuticoccus kalidii TaxID=2910977 RepID=UPI001F22B199|nr:hypothetical protein [Acuticoccus kalidii]MCF3932503.1 hypothetical protein [Acuticoccus kalidii]